MSLPRLSIRARLIGAFALLMVLLVSLSAVALTATRTINDHLVRMQGDRLPRIEKIGGIDTWIARYAVGIYRHFAAPDAETMKQVEAEISQSVANIERRLAEYPAFVSSAEEQNLYDKLNETWTRYQTEIKPILALSREGMSDTARELLQGKPTALQRAATAMAEDLLALNLQAAGRSKLEGEAAYTQTQTAVLGASGAGFLLSVLLTVLIVRGVTGGIASVVGPMRALAGGDLSADIPHRGERTEVGTIADAVQVFKDGLIRARRMEAETAQARSAAEEHRKAGMRQMADGFEAAVGGIIGLVSASATELQATAQAMAATATRTARQSTTVAAAAEAAASNVSTVAAAAEQLGSSVAEIGRHVDGSASLAQRAVSEADQTGAMVEELNDAVSRIGQVVGMISTIAGQTNLLALNATIEAARAGAAGKGFAVVAAEVKALAGQTAKATDEISGQIARIQSSTGQAVSAIGSMTVRIQEISSVATSIAAAVEEQGAATQEIVRNVSQAAAGTGAVTSNIAGVAGAAEETGAAASRVLGAASELSQRSETLAAEVGRFLATVRAA